MTEKILTGEQAIAYGALEADVRVVTGYPGSPATKVLTNILELTEGDAGRYVEWSINEKVAFEIALGTSLGGDRALVCLKSVGMNITVDPIMTANLTGINAGLVILLGDDPGAWLSQNEQDTRLLVEFMELPLLEPSSPQEARDMMAAAFSLSEEFDTVVVVRIIRSLSVAEGLVRLTDNPVERKPKPFIREKNRWVSTTFNVLDNHKKLHEKLGNLEQRFADSQFNEVMGEPGQRGIIAAGNTYSKLLEAFKVKPDDFSILKLGTINPLPAKVIRKFLDGTKSVMILEDNEPYVENKVRAIAHEAHLDIEIFGKLDGHIPREGELSVAILEHIINQADDEEFTPKSQVSSTTQKSFCDGCPYTPIFQALSEVIAELGENPVIIAEPGCGVKLNSPPFEMLDVKYSMGSAIGIAAGLARARAGIKPIAVCGDSSFFHTGVNGLLNTVGSKQGFFILILDNSVAALTGYQTHPGTGKNARGQETKAIDIAEIARICHVPSVCVVDPDESEPMKAAFRDALVLDGLSVVVARKPCPRPT